MTKKNSDTSRNPTFRKAHPSQMPFTMKAFSTMILLFSGYADGFGPVNPATRASSSWGAAATATPSSSSSSSSSSLTPPSILTATRTFATAKRGFLPRANTPAPTALTTPIATTTTLFDSESNVIEVPTQRSGWRRAISLVLPGGGRRRRRRRRRGRGSSVSTKIADDSLLSMHMVMIDEDLSRTALSPVRVMANSTNNDVADFMIKNLETMSPLVIDNPDIVVLGNDPPSLSVIELVESDLDAVVLEEGSGPETAAANDDVRTLNRRETVSKGKAKTKTSSVVNKENPKANTDTIPVADNPNGQDAGSFAARLSGHYTQNLLTGLIERWTTEPPTNMKVRVTPSDSVVKRIVVGKFQGNAEVTFDRLVFAPIRVSSGTVEAKRMLLNLWSFTPDLLRQNVRRYPAQFDFLFKDCTFTENDLFESDSIRNGLRDLLVLVLQRVGIKPKQVAVNSIRVLPNNKISIGGSASLGYGAKVLYEVRTGISTASRGHILTFPGLEISINPSLNMFVPVLPEIDLDIGHNARVTKVNIDGRNRQLRFSGSTTITPDHTVALRNYTQSKASYMAQFYFDVGAWLTKLGRFTY